MIIDDKRMSDEEIKLIRNFQKLLQLFYAYEAGEISKDMYWNEVLRHLTPEDALKIPYFSARYH